MNISFRDLLACAAAGALALGVASTIANAKPVEYVKICSLYGAGFYYVPGTDICLKVGGYIRQDNYNYQFQYQPAPKSASKLPFTSFERGCEQVSRDTHYVRLDGRDTCVDLQLDSRTQTAYGTLRAYLKDGVPQVQRQSFFDLFNPAQFQDQRGGIAGDNWTPSYTAQLGSGVTAEITMFAGSVNATSFGSTFNTGLAGARSALSYQFAAPFRLQTSVEGLTTGTYSLAAQDRWYLASFTHFVWEPMANLEVGALGGGDHGKPTYTSTQTGDWIFGGEGRYFGNGWMIGTMGGRLDVSSGPGTQTRVDWIEGRGRVSLGNFLPSWSDLTLSGTYGYASGKLANTQIGATSTQWNTSLSYSFRGTPLTIYGSYTGYENRTDTSGTVWRENILKGGIQLNFGVPSTPQKQIEPHSPDPIVLQSKWTF
jgi:hypothetical protein